MVVDAPTVDALIARAQARFPDVRVDPVSFRAHVARHRPETGALRDERGEELWLAFAVGSGDAAAVRALERDWLPKVDSALARLRGPADLKAEARQKLLEKLAVADHGGHPRALDFAAKSTLLAWLRAAAVRIGLNLLEAQREVPVDEEALLERALPVGDPALDVLKANDVQFLKQALRVALEELSPDPKALLRQYYFEGLGLEALSKIHRVNASTISRRLSKTREALLGQVRRALAQTLRMSGREVDSLIRAVGSQLEISRLTAMF